MKEVEFKELYPEVAPDGFFGDETKSDYLGIVARYNDRPIPLSLKKIFADFGINLLGHDSTILNINKIYKKFNLWLIPHSVGLIRTGGSRDVTAVGIDIEYLNADATCSTVSLIPMPKYIKQGEFQANVDLLGEINDWSLDDILPDSLSEMLGLNFSYSTKCRMSLGISARVLTPYIAAIGRGGSYASWRFDKYDTSLLGHDIETWSILALPKYQEELIFKARYYYDSRQLFITRRYESEWQEIKCILKD